MRTSNCVVFVLFIIAFLLAAPIVYSQTAPQGRQDSSNQWVSHQMNQPPPDRGKKYELSEDIVEEIRQLYLRAKQEIEVKTQQPKPNP